MSQLIYRRRHVIQFKLDNMNSIVSSNYVLLTHDELGVLVLIGCSANQLQKMTHYLQVCLFIAFSIYISGMVIWWIIVLLFRTESSTYISTLTPTVGHLHSCVLHNIYTTKLKSKKHQCGSPISVMKLQ
jgi:hypothetical protein